MKQREGEGRKEAGRVRKAREFTFPSPLFFREREGSAPPTPEREGQG